MTRQQLEAVVDCLVELVSDWNDAAEDEDRGRADDAICLTLCDDGSGRLGRRRTASSEVEDWHEFNDLDGLIEVLTQGECVELEAARAGE